MGTLEYPFTMRALTEAVPGASWARGTCPSSCRATCGWWSWREATTRPPGCSPSGTRRFSPGCSQLAHGYVDYCWPGHSWRRPFDGPDAGYPLVWREEERIHVR